MGTGGGAVQPMAASRLYGFALRCSRPAGLTSQHACLAAGPWALRTNGGLWQQANALANQRLPWTSMAARVRSRRAAWELAPQGRAEHGHTGNEVCDRTAGCTYRQQGFMRLRGTGATCFCRRRAFTAACWLGALRPQSRARYAASGGGASGRDSGPARRVQTNAMAAASVPTSFAPPLPTHLAGRPGFSARRFRRRCPGHSAWPRLAARTLHDHFRKFGQQRRVAAAAGGVPGANSLGRLVLFGATAGHHASSACVPVAGPSKPASNLFWLTFSAAPLRSQGNSLGNRCPTTLAPLQPAAW